MRKILFFLLLCFSMLGFSQSNTMQANSAREENLLKNLRCLVCQNESLADSDAPLAKDLRHNILLQIHDGRSDQEIIDYLTQRYGEFILFKPAVNQHTILLWFGPFLFLGLGVGIWLLVIRRLKN